ncbi:MAG: DUF1624 domain-containing protein [Oscillospiraceae bacterium]|jgi:uncharacterized membrane protein|nr:DUF1624 domain-containing protein [Oscillospiraceae bacterium]
MQKRIQIIDALRGLAVILMVIHHALFDAVEFYGAPAWLFTNPVFDVLHWFFAGVFIFLCGVSSRFSRSNLKRGLKTAIAAAVVSLVTWAVGEPILFGILHLLAVCMIVYGVIRIIIPASNKPLSPAGGTTAQPIIWIALIIASALAVKYVAVSVDWLWVFGWTYPGFYSADYFPLLPWVFVFALGTWAGKPIRDGKLPQWFYETRVAFLPGVGRHSFIIYLAHQPILYGVPLLVMKLVGDR